MPISLKGEYALQAVLDLSMQRQGEPVKIADIARRQKIPQKFLELILGRTQAGWICGVAAGGRRGYLLARRAETLTVGEVLRSRGKGRAFAPVAGKAQGGYALHDLMERVDRAVSGVVDKTTFLDLRREWEEQQTRYTPSWDI